MNWTRSANTRNGYASDWRVFCAWCERSGRPSLPASTETVLLYVADMVNREKRISTVKRHVASVVFYHRTAGLPNPASKSGEVWQAISGAQRLRCEQPQGKAPLTVEQLRRICENLMKLSSAIAARNQAVLVFGFTSALRRSNIVAADLSDLQFTDQGLVVSVRREKQDQVGRGRVIGLPFSQSAEICPVKTMLRWLSFRGSAPGPVFTVVNNGKPTITRLHTERVAVIVQAGVVSIGLPPRRYGAHSLRSGFVTEAASAGANELLIAKQTGHRSLASLHRYFRPSDPFRGNACSILGL